uniref:Transmembrane protein 144 (inferred by orthology to a human protein) n=1 Tax=Strongyloides venezuelensis TaxID=75913 RepID=A0A0K0FE40_STRVS
MSFEEDTPITIYNISQIINLPQDNNITLGIFYCFISAIGFGSMHIPILRYNKGNGSLAQFGVGVGVLFASLLNCIFFNKNFYINAYPMIGGFLWTIANFGSYFVIDVYGIGIAMLIWNVGNCLTGWATGYFGLFGIKPRKPKNFMPNIIGVILIIISGVIFSFVRKSSKHSPIDGTVLLENNTRINVFSSKTSANNNNNIGRVSVKFKKVLALVAALICGFFFASTTTPIYYLLDNPNELLDRNEKKLTSFTFILSLGLGVFTTTSLLFFSSIHLYGLRSDVLGSKDILLSSIVSGFIWLNSMCLMLKAIDIVSQTITYPIMSICPGFIGTMWSIFYFKEIHGLKNYLAIFFAIFIASCGIFLLVISKI